MLLSPERQGVATHQRLSSGDRRPTAVLRSERLARVSDDVEQGLPQLMIMIANGLEHHEQHPVVRDALDEIRDVRCDRGAGTSFDENQVLRPVAELASSRRVEEEAEPDDSSLRPHGGSPTTPRGINEPLEPVLALQQLGGVAGARDAQVVHRATEPGGNVSAGEARSFRTGDHLHRRPTESNDG